MPSLLVPMKPLADATFLGRFKQISVGWQQPQGQEADQYRDAFDPAQHMGVPEPGCYFWSVSTNEYHVNQSKMLGREFKDFVHTMLDGIKQAVDLWRVKAQFQNLTINAAFANGTPGCLFGPSLEPDIKMLSYPTASGYRKKWRDAVAAGVAECWKEWADNVTVPGLLFYPAFIAFPAPFAPPMPNIPQPLISCPSTGMVKMTPAMLQQAMVNHFDVDEQDGQFAAVANAIGTALSAAFMSWLPAQQITNVYGQGPIPTYAPPVMPVGPVVMGFNTPSPGHLSA